MLLSVTQAESVHILMGQCVSGCLTQGKAVCVCLVRVCVYVCALMCMYARVCVCNNPNGLSCDLGNGERKKE